MLEKRNQSSWRRKKLLLFQSKRRKIQQIHGLLGKKSLNMTAKVLFGLSYEEKSTIWQTSLISIQEETSLSTELAVIVPQCGKVIIPSKWQNKVLTKNTGLEWLEITGTSTLGMESFTILSKKELRKLFQKKTDDITGKCTEKLSLFW